MNTIQTKFSHRGAEVNASKSCKKNLNTENTERTEKTNRGVYFAGVSLKRPYNSKIIRISITLLNLLRAQRKIFHFLRKCGISLQFWIPRQAISPICTSFQRSSALKKLKLCVLGASVAKNNLMQLPWFKPRAIASNPKKVDGRGEPWLARKKVSSVGFSRCSPCSRYPRWLIFLARLNWNCFCYTRIPFQRQS